MPVQLNHTIVHVRDRENAAKFYADILGVPIAGRLGPFVAVALAHDMTLDFMTVPGPIHAQHYAFLVSDEEWDEIFGRVKARGLEYWADPFHRRPGETNTEHHGRGVYFDDPDGHNLEILTHSYELQ